MDISFDNTVLENKNPRVITFECDEIIVKDHSLETKWGNGVPLNFEEYDTLVFSGNNKKYTYKRI